jgi:hypothetical protein
MEFLKFEFRGFDTWDLNFEVGPENKGLEHEVWSSNFKGFKIHKLELSV